MAIIQIKPGIDETYMTVFTHWNMASTTCNGAGFRSSETIQMVCADGVWRLESLTTVNSDSLQAIRHELTAVSVPPAIVLFLSGFLSLHGFRWVATKSNSD
jgi:hypothetical protein